MAEPQDVKVGFALAMLTVVMWSSITIAIKFAVLEIDPYTLVWYRFLIASIGLTLYLSCKGLSAFPDIRLFQTPKWLILLIIAVGGLSGNFVLFAKGLAYISPTASQVIAQLAVVVFMISSALIFKERMRPTQIMGILVLITGLLLFFNRSLLDLFSNLSLYAKGIWLCLTASLIWSCYALAQKVLLQKLKPIQILWLLCILCVVVIYPLATPAKIVEMGHVTVLAVIYCGCNTIVGYGSYIAATHKWQAAPVSAVTTLSPLFALLFTDIIASIWPEMFVFTRLNFLGYIGAFAVVGGAMFATIGHYIWQPRRGFLLNKKRGEFE